MKTKITLLFLLLLQLSVYCQKQTKTSFMVVPGDNWMTQNGYYKMVDNQGDEEPVFNYKKALLENTDICYSLDKRTRRERNRLTDSGSIQRTEHSNILHHWKRQRVEEA